MARTFSEEEVEVAIDEARVLVGAAFGQGAAPLNAVLRLLVAAVMLNEAIADTAEQAERMQEASATLLRDVGRALRGTPDIVALRQTIDRAMQENSPGDYQAMAAMLQSTTPGETQ